MNAKTRIFLRSALFFVLVAAVAVGTALLLTVLWLRPEPSRHAAADLYEELALSPDEQEKIAEVHQRFEADRADLLREFQRLQGRLAALLKEEQSFSPALAETIEQLHEIHAQLQAISIRRFFAMLETLPIEKQEKLRTLAAETLSQPE